MIGAEVLVGLDVVVTVEDVVLEIIGGDAVVESHVLHSTKHRRRIAEPNRGSEQIVRF